MEILGVSYSCAKQAKVLQKNSPKNKYYAVLGLTNIAGHDVMCIIILVSVEHIHIVESGLNLLVPEFGEVVDSHYFCDNSGPGKRFLGGLSYDFDRKHVPCLTQWDKKGGITTNILCDIIVALDNTQVFDEHRSKGIKPLILVNEHGSRYIYDQQHDWAVVIGVLYGAAL